MKSILLIGHDSRKQDAKKLLQHQRDFQGNAESLQVSICYYDELRIELATGKFEIHDERNNSDISKYDVVLLRGAMPSTTLPFVVSSYLRQRNVTHQSDFTGYRTLNKLCQLATMAELGMPIPRTVFIQNKQILQTYAIHNRWKYPLIVKSATASQGEKNYLIHDEPNLASVLAAHEWDLMMVEEYIPNDGDYRLLLLGSQTLLFRRVGKSGSHIHNASQGGSFEPVPVTELEPQTLQQARALATQLGLSISGIDIIVRKPDRKPFFLEANSQPGWAYTDVVQAHIPAYLKSLLSDD